MSTSERPVPDHDRETERRGEDLLHQSLPAVPPVYHNPPEIAASTVPYPKWPLTQDQIHKLADRMMRSELTIRRNGFDMRITAKDIRVEFQSILKECGLD